MDGRKVAFWIVLGLALGYSGAARSQEPEPISQDDTKARLEQQDRKIQELMETVKMLQSSQARPAAAPAAALPTGTSSLTETDVQKIVGDYLKTVEEKKSQEVGYQGQAAVGPPPVPARKPRKVTASAASWA